MRGTETQVKAVARPWQRLQIGVGQLGNLLPAGIDGRGSAQTLVDKYPYRRIAGAIEQVIEQIFDSSLRRRTGLVVEAGPAALVGNLPGQHLVELQRPGTQILQHQ